MDPTKIRDPSTHIVKQQQHRNFGLVNKCISTSNGPFHLMGVNGMTVSNLTAVVGRESRLQSMDIWNTYIPSQVLYSYNFP